MPASPRSRLRGRRGLPLGWALALGLAALPGCREELGPEVMPTTRVVGRVHLRHLPVTGGWIEFYPTAGTVGNLRSARIRPDGSFEADRVAIGTNAIRLVNPPGGVLERLPKGYEFKMRPLIRHEVATRPVTTLDIDLQDEWVRLHRSG